MGYLLLLLVLGGLAAAAQNGFQAAFRRYSRLPARSGLTGAEAAAWVLRQGGVDGVRIEPARGRFGDHYDPRTRTLRLSPEVLGGRSVAALGVAAHEAGHAIQHAHGYLPLRLRSAAVPTASLGSSLGFPLIFLGLILHSLHLAVFGLVLFAAVVLFQLITLPVEFDASRRAEAALARTGLVAGGEEAEGVRKVLNAAAMTYVVAALTGVVQLLWFAAAVFGGNRR
ncbi:MAG: zinc metallopeptidase [Planctomycetota bacterium]|nr:MAG: zinc metallopeptidase [Planctomycetota bacterium]